MNTDNAMTSCMIFSCGRLITVKPIRLAGTCNRYSNSAMPGGLDVQVLDANGDVVAYTAGIGRMMTGGTPPEGTQVTARAAIKVNGEVVGQALVVQSAPGGTLTERDVWFQRTSPRGLTL